jgi:prepilin-type N-terminal cleavage/methylation domain-containing protein
MAGCSDTATPIRDGQSGMSLVEVVIAMFILAVMSSAVLPLLIGGIQVSAVNRDAVAANAFANSQLAQLQASFPNSAENSCAAVTAAAASGVADPSGSGSVATIAVGECPTSYPGVVRVTVTVFRPSATKATVTLTSALLVATP